MDKGGCNPGEGQDAADQVFCAAGVSLCCVYTTYGVFSCHQHSTAETNLCLGSSPLGAQWLQDGRGGVNGGLSVAVAQSCSLLACFSPQ